MKKYPLTAAILLSVVLFSCGDNAEETPVPQQETEIPTEQAIPDTEAKPSIPKPQNETHVEISKQEDQLVSLIWKLPEVQELETRIEKQSKGKRSLVGRISSKPSDDQEYYSVAISEDNGEALATYFEFHIYPGNEIYFYDVVEDKELSLKEWRAQK